MATNLQKRLGIGRMTDQHPARKAAEERRKAQEEASKPQKKATKKVAKKTIPVGEDAHGNPTKKESIPSGSNSDADSDA